MSLSRRGCALLVAALSLMACAKGEGAAGDSGAAAAVSIKGGTITGSGNGFRMTMTGTTERAGAAGPVARDTAPMSTTTTVRVLDGKARIDFARGAAPGMTAGGWMLVEAAGGRMSIVDPAAKRVIVMDSLGALGGMAGMGGMMQMTVKDTSSKVEDLGAGETILGFATHKYRTTIAYTMEMNIMGRAMPMRTEQVTVAHMSEDAMLRDAGFDAFEQSFKASMGGVAGSGAADAIRALGAVRPKGVALMQSMESRVIRNGDTTATRSTYRVTELARGAGEASDFVVPADFTRDDIGARVREAQSKADAAMQKAGVSGEQMRKAMEAMQKARGGRAP